MTEAEKAMVQDLKDCLNHICSFAKDIRSAQWHAASTLARCAMVEREGREPTTQESLDWIREQDWAFVSRWTNKLRDMKASPGAVKEFPKCHCGSDAEFIIDGAPRCFEHRTTHKEG